MTGKRGSPRLWSRNGLTLEIKFPGVLKAVGRLKLRSAILDGEIVAIDDEGIREIPIAPEMVETGKRSPRLLHVRSTLDRRD